MYTLMQWYGLDMATSIFEHADFEVVKQRAVGCSDCFIVEVTDEHEQVWQFKDNEWQLVLWKLG